MSVDSVDIYVSNYRVTRMEEMTREDLIAALKEMTQERDRIREDKERYGMALYDILSGKCGSRSDAVSFALEALRLSPTDYCLGPAGEVTTSPFGDVNNVTSRHDGEGNDEE